MYSARVAVPTPPPVLRATPIGATRFARLAPPTCTGTGRACQSADGRRTPPLCSTPRHHRDSTSVALAARLPLAQTPPSAGGSHPETHYQPPHRPSGPTMAATSGWLWAAELSHPPAA